MARRSPEGAPSGAVGNPGRQPGQSEATTTPAQPFGQLAEIAAALLDHARALRLGYEELEGVLSETVGEADRSGQEPLEHRARAAPDGGEGAVDGQPGSAAASDDEGALLVALDMALNGTPREETAAYLRETFGVDRGDILDEAYGKGGAPAGRGD